MSIFISGMWIGWPSSVVDKFVHNQTDVHIGYDELSWIVCIMDLGNVISPVFGGYLMDKIGRKLTIAVLGPLFIVSWLLTLHGSTTWTLYVARFTAGLGKGMSYTVVPVFLGEIAGVNIRGALGGVFATQLSFGFLFEVIIGSCVSYRTLNAVSLMVPVLFFAMFVWVPESPYYLLKRGRKTGAAECLRWYRCDADGDDVGAELQQMEVNVRKDMENKATFHELFTNRKNFKALMVVVTACVAQRAGGISSLVAYASLILPEPAPIIGKFEYIMIFATMMVTINFIGLALVDRIGRKPLLIFSELSLAAVMIVFGLYNFLTVAHGGGITTAAHWLPYMCYLVFSIAYSMGVGFIPVVLLAEMFPVNVRSHCSAIVSITLAFFSFVSNKIFLIVSQKYGYHVMFWGFAVINATCAYFAYRYVIETKGKTFLEIQEMLEESVQNDGTKNAKKRKRVDVSCIT